MSQDYKLIKCGTIIDVENGKVQKNIEILIKDNIIVKIGQNLDRPDKCGVIDLSGMTVLPGLIDAHTHICINPDYSKRDPILYETIPYRAVKASVAAEKNLKAGFTSLRDVGCEGAFLADIAVKNAINDGLIKGPRMQVASLALTILGGYEDIRGYSPELNLPSPGVVVNSREEMIKEVRRQIKCGADLIKIYATGTVSDISRDTFEPLSQMEIEDIKAVVKEAKRWNKFVSAHAYGGRGAKNAILGGVRSIEHGILLNEELLDLMKENNVFWCPTLNVYRSLKGAKGIDENVLQYILNNHRKIFKITVEKGVKIAFGTDTGAIPHGKNAEEFVTMVKYGMSPMKAIQSATIVAAELMGWENKVGSIKKGKYADIIAVNDNPLDNISVLKDVKFVMKNGNIVKNSVK